MQLLAAHSVELQVHVTPALCLQKCLSAVSLLPEADAAIDILLGRLQSQLPGLHPVMAAAEEQPGRHTAKTEVSKHQDCACPVASGNPIISVPCCIIRCAGKSQGPSRQPVQGRPNSLQPD